MGKKPAEGQTSVRCSQNKIGALVMQVDASLGIYITPQHGCCSQENPIRSCVTKNLYYKRTVTFSGTQSLSVLCKCGARALDEMLCMRHDMLLSVTLGLCFFSPLLWFYICHCTSLSSLLVCECESEFFYVSSRLAWGAQLIAIHTRSRRDPSESILAVNFVASAAAAAEWLWLSLLLLLNSFYGHKVEREFLI